MPISPLYQSMDQINAKRQNPFDLSTAPGGQADQMGLGVTDDVAQPMDSYGLGANTDLAPQPLPNNDFSVNSQPDMPQTGAARLPPQDQGLYSFLNSQYPDKFKQAQNTYDQNKVSREELDDASKQNLLNSLVGSFSQAAGAAGSIGGKATQSSLPEYAQTLAANTKENLAGRQQLATQAQTEMQNAVKGYGDVQKEQYEQQLRPFELEQKKQQGYLGAANVSAKQEELENTQKLRDPNSTETLALREMAKMMNPKADPASFDNMNGDQIMKLSPAIEKAGAAALRSEDQKARLAQQAEEAQLNRSAKYADMKLKLDQVKENSRTKDDKEVNSAYERLGKSISPMAGRAGEFGQAVKKLNNADAVKTMIYNNNGVLQNLDARQMQELAIAMNRMLGGSEAAGQIEHLLPKSAQGNTQKAIEWLTNEPRGLNQLKFVEQMAHTVDRESQLAERLIHREQMQRVKTGYDWLRTKDPERFNEMLDINGIKPEEYEAYKKGGYTSLAKGGEHSAATNEDANIPVFDPSKYK